ncbi:hypothetical protein RB195_019034 [Necator americanus]|uniref:Uncharacterized protein n=1 Tax=Necator americanus TaxID=51031 RepID=A0ABR1CEZ4_NECAM
MTGSKDAVGPIAPPSIGIWRRWTRHTPSYRYLAPAHQFGAGGPIAPRIIAIRRRHTNVTPVDPSHPLL